MKKFLENHPKLYEIIRFVLVGGLATIIDFLCMSLFIYVCNASIYNNIIEVFLSNTQATTWSVVVGTGVGFVISLVVNYILSLLFVFRVDNQNAKTTKGIILFLILSLVSLGIQTLLMYLGYDILRLNKWLLKVIITIITMIFNYLTRKKLVFVNKNNIKDTRNNSINTEEKEIKSDEKESQD